MPNFEQRDLQASDKYGLTEKYGPLLTLPQLAEVLQRSVVGVRASLSYKDEFSVSLQNIKKKIGRRIYFRAIDIEKMIDEL